MENGRINGGRVSDVNGTGEQKRRRGSKERHVKEGGDEENRAGAGLWTEN